METKEPMPSVIARLMGLDEQPPPQPVQKKARVLSENYLQRLAAIGVRKKYPESDSFRFRNEEQREYKQIFQILESLKRGKHHNISDEKKKARSSSLVKKITPGRQTFIEAKLNDLQDVPHHLQSGDISAGLCRKSSRISKQECFNLLKKKDNFRLLTNEIVVLKPALEETENTTSCFSTSPTAHNVSLSNDGKILNPQSKSTHIEVKERKKLTNVVAPVRSRSRFAKERTKEMGLSRISMPMVAPSPEIRSNSSETLAKDSELKSSYSLTLADWKKQFYLSDRSYMASEAKKQISERWKMNKKYEQFEPESRSKTLGEILAISDHDKPKNVDYKFDKNGMSNQSGSDGQNMKLGSASHISSWNDTKDRQVRDLTRSGSLLAKFNEVGSPPTLAGYECRALESIHLVHNKSRKKDCKQEERLECRNSDSSYMKSPSNPCVKLEKSNSAGRNDQTLQITKVTDTEPEGVKQFPLNHKEQQLESNQFNASIKDEVSFPHVINASIQQDISNVIFEEDFVSSHCSGMDPDSLMSMEEAYQPSPNSVLEPFYKKEISSGFDCFDSVGASLKGLEMQLELLKSDMSETFSEGSGVAVSSDEDTGEVSLDQWQVNEEIMKPFRVEESRDFSYLVDVIEAGFKGRILDMGVGTWHSQDCPMSSSVFETLEKKYGKQVSWKRSERKLLFDRLNSGLMENFQPSFGVSTWKTSVARRFGCEHGREEVEEELWRLLVSQEKEACNENEKVLGKDDRWLELGDDIQAIGREIENYLIDELLADIGMELSLQK